MIKRSVVKKQNAVKAVNVARIRKIVVRKEVPVAKTELVQWKQESVIRIRRIKSLVRRNQAQKKPVVNNL
jgi:hypothetical protein